MVSLKHSGREIPALINHLQIILVQTLSVQIDNGYLIQKKRLVSQKFCGGWKMVNPGKNKQTIKQSRKAPNNQNNPGFRFQLPYYLLR